MKKQITKANSILWSASLALTFFWVLNILKEVFSSVKNFLNFYSPVGPLLGLFLFSGLFAFVAYLIILTVKPASQKLAFWSYLISAVVFFLMVFPPIFEPLVDILINFLS